MLLLPHSSVFLTGLFPSFSPYFLFTFLGSLLTSSHFNFNAVAVSATWEFKTSVMQWALKSLSPVQASSKLQTHVPNHPLKISTTPGTYPNTTSDFTSAAALWPSHLTFFFFPPHLFMHSDYRLGASFTALPPLLLNWSANPVVFFWKKHAVSPHLSYLPLSTPPPLLPTGLLSAIPDATSSQRSALAGPWHLEHCSPRSPTKVFPPSLQRPFQATKYTTVPLGYAIHCTLSTLFFHSNFHCLVFYLGPTYLFACMFLHSIKIPWGCYTFCFLLYPQHLLWTWTLPTANKCFFKKL